MGSTVVNKLFKEIKSLLISTDETKQQDGLDRLHIIMKSYEKMYPLTVEGLIDADLIEILCDKLSTVNSSLILSVFKDLELILFSKCFIKPHQLMCVFESVVRTIQISVKRQNKVILSQGCIILSVITRRLVKTKIDLAYFCDMELFDVITKILEYENSSCSDNAIEFLIEIMVVIIKFKDKDFSKDLVIGTLSQAINHLCHNIDGTRLQKLSKVIILSLRFVSSQSSNKTDQSFTGIILKVINDKFISPLMRVDFRNIGEDFSLVMRTILGVYFLQDNNTKHLFSVHLLSIKFLETLQSFEMICTKQNQYLLIRSLMYEILLCLCINELGKHDWESTLKNGLLTIPFRDPFTSLKNKDDGESTIIIIFNYFKLLPYFRPLVNQTYAVELNNFILNLKKLPSESLMKALWFEFAAAQLSHQQMKDYGNKSAKIVINLLKKYNFTDTYTHHPVIIKWTFSVKFDHEFRKGVLRTWLEKNDSILQEAISLFLISNQEAFPVFLELLASNELGNLTPKIMLQFMSELRKSDSDIRRKFCEEAWMLLPHILATFSPMPKQIQNITNLFSICKESVPENLDKAILTPIGCLLPGVIIKCYECARSSNTSEISTADYVTLRECFIFASIIIEQALRIKRDEKVLMAFLQHQTLLDSLESCFSTVSDINVSSSLLELLGYMLQFQLQYHTESIKVIQLQTPKIINLLCGDIAIAMTGLRLLALFLEGYVDSKINLFIQLPVPTAVELRALYIRIHMICAQANDDVCCWCWICLHYLLKLSNKFKLHFHLGTLHYTQNLLVACSPQSKAWTQMLDFLPGWLSLLPPTNRRVFNLSSTQKTLTVLAKNFFTQTKHLIDPKLRCVLFKVLKSEAIPGVNKDDHNQH